MWPSSRISWKVNPETVSVAVVPGPPACAIKVKGRLAPAPIPVTVAVPCRTSVPSRAVTEVTLPVTYMALTSKSPLSGLKLVATGGISAKHSKSPPCPLAWKARTVVRYEPGTAALDNRSATPGYLVVALLRGAGANRSSSRSDQRCCQYCGADQ